ncbi:glycosyltransferase family 4 protein [Bacteroides salyersiae]|uniref:glycosyltransferase family 4 protein n=1 Tax=Bacteroides salyersiae TaxID=291644 RepID=UPI001C8B5AAD|nr:glycosyltransferase family 4 protein [Bacteroides salyersiae]
MQDKKKIIRAATVSISTIFFKPIVKDLQAKGYEVISLTSPGPELTELAEMGVKCIEVPMERHISLWNDFKSLLQLIKVFRKEQPFIVHSMTPKAGMLCMVAAWIVRVPKRVHTFTGLVWPTTVGLKRRVLMGTDWLTCVCATHVIPEGKGVMDDLQTYITKKPMKVLGYGNVRGVDMERFSRRSEVVEAALKIKKEGVFTFVFVGRIVGDKGINELVEAFIHLLKDNPNVRLILVGPYEDNLDPVSILTKERINNTPQIVAVGSIFDDTLLLYYAASDCFVFPSYREGFPNTVMEAGAMGLPSIVTDINGSREIIENGKNGIIIPSKNSDALYEAMKSMLDDNEAYVRMSANARPMIESRFEQGFVKSCLLDFYDEII